MARRSSTRVPAVHSTTTGRNKRKRSTRRLARSILAVLLIGLVVGGGFVFFVERGHDVVKAIGELVPPPPPEPGAARRWEAQIPVATYTTWNARHGNTLTTLPVAGWGGRGPAVSMSLYHNSATIDSTENLTVGMGFDMGPGWTTSYSAHLVMGTTPPPGLFDTVTIVDDDGTRSTFVEGITVDWIPPKGVFSQLSFDEGDPPTNPPTWTLLETNQWSRVFDETGLLIQIIDDTGNVLGVTRTTGENPRITEITEITEAVFEADRRRLQFQYDAGGVLISFFDPKELSDGDRTIGNRSWNFTYAAGRLESFEDAAGAFVTIDQYDADGRIEQISDKKSFGTPGGDVYTYAYDIDGVLETVTDPTPASGTAKTQGLARTANDGNRVSAFYTDRRGNVWRYDHWADATIAFPDGNITFVTNPLGDVRSFFYDGGRNVDTSIDERNNLSEWTYDFSGNMTSATDPLLNVQTWTYDAVNNVTSYTDGEGNTVSFLYEKPEYPTLLTKIIEPPAGNPLATAETILEYHLPDPTLGIRCGESTDPGCGQLATVIDPNGVVTLFEYDLWGQLAIYGEGIPESGGGGGAAAASGAVFQKHSTRGSGGETTSSSSSGGGSGDVNSDGEGRPTSTVCLPQVSGSTAAIPGSTFPPLPNNVAEIPVLRGSFLATQGYNPRGQLPHITIDADLGYEGDPPPPSVDSFTRKQERGFDERGRLTSITVSSNECGDVCPPEPDPRIFRTFNYFYDIDIQTEVGMIFDAALVRAGPDGVQTITELDAANRVKRVVRQFPVAPIEQLSIMQADFTYLPNGLVNSVSYPTNGAGVLYSYDAADRVTTIDHRDWMDLSLLTLAYTYQDNNVISTITESNHLGPLATVTFTYDARGRLTHEERTDFDSTREYDFTYEYDQGGNRTMKISPLTDFGGLRHEVRYDYDVNRPDPDPEGYITRNNRLMKVETYDIFEDGMSENLTAPETFGLAGGGTQQAQGPPPPPAEEIEILLSTSWYYYSEAGNVERVVTNVAGTQAYSATRLGYAQNGQAVTFAVGETWNWTGGGPPPTGYGVTYAREFRYDGARARYLVRELFAPHFANNQYTVAGGELGNTWTDYDGDTAYGDYEIVPDGFDEEGLFVPAHGESIRSYQPGIGLVDPFETLDGTSTSYYMGDHLGTTRGMTDPTGAAVESAAFTAFGERVGGNARRFGYVGAWGYQTATSDDAYADFPFQHVGARYYDPVSGRFLQRDPIGIYAGPNVYSYVRNQPVAQTDPQGLQVGPPHNGDGPLGGMGDLNVPDSDPEPGPQVPPGKPPPLGPLQPLMDMLDRLLYLTMGGIGATVGELTMACFLVPLWTDHDFGEIYSAYWKGYKDFKKAQGY